jgi:hypothetical protein
MSGFSENFVNKLKKVADEVAREKSKLYFFGLVRRDDAPPNRWDLLVSSERLQPWSLEAINYIVEQLKKKLTADEMIRIARIVVLPRNNSLITDLLKDSQAVAGVSGSNLHPMDQPDRAMIIWPVRKSLRPVKTA